MKNINGVNTEYMKLPLVEEFSTIQGEGFHAGMAAWFIRLAGCDVGCSWCDSRFTWNQADHPMVNTDVITDHAIASGMKSAVITGGEPLIWNLDYLCSVLRKNGVATFLETSGAYPLSGEWDWICLSPKRNKPPMEEICRRADELKVVIKNSSDFEWAEEYRKKVKNTAHLFLQPEWNSFGEIIPHTVGYVKLNPEWRISLQLHKYMHIP